MTDRARRRAAASDTTSRERREDNPFAPPPEGQPDQPWQPRRPSAPGGSNDTGHGTGQGSGNGSRPGSGSDSGSDSDSDSGSGAGSGSGGSSGSGAPEQGKEQQPWGSWWSSQQPGRQSGGFGGQGGNDEGPGRAGPGGGASRGGMRWDPSDPMQRRARYSLHAGIWGLFFALFSLTPVALLLGALSLYWGISALRAASRTKRGEAPSGEQSPRATAEDIAGSARAPEEREPSPSGAAAVQQQMRVAVTPAQAAKSQATAAIGGLVTAVLTLAVVASTFAFQMAYKDYFTCQQDALTQSSREQCQELLPENLRPFLENRSG